MKKYLISQDVELLMKAWAHKRGFILPSSLFFHKLYYQLIDRVGALFKEEKGREKVEVEAIPHCLLSVWIDLTIATEDNAALISLDNVYPTRTDGYISINRMVARDGKQWKDIGRGPRPGFPIIENQLQAICQFPQSKIVLIDDGCWSGGSIDSIVKELEEAGKEISSIVIGILIKEKSSLINRGVKPCLVYSKEEIIDWVCERDFFLGVPLGGRTLGYLSGEEVKPVDNNVGVPYLFGFGDPVEWASLDFHEDQLKNFSLECLHQNIKVFKEVESLSNRKVMVGDVDRIPWGINQNPDRGFVDVLREQVKRVNSIGKKEVRK